jgi:hypothetical protein
LKPQELHVLDSSREPSEPALLSPAETAKLITVDNAERHMSDSALSNVQMYLQEVARAFDCLRRYYADSFVPHRTPRKTVESARNCNSFSAEALVLLCEDFDMCPHPFPPAFICKVYSSLTNASDSPSEMIARCLVALASAGFRHGGIPGRLLSEEEAFVAVLQHMHYSQGPSRLHTALGMGTANRPVFRVPAPTYDGKTDKSYFVECLPMLLPTSAYDANKHAPCRGMLDNSSSSGSGIPSRGLARANQVAVANRMSRFIKLYREENNSELTGAPVLTQKSSDFERGIHDLLEFSRNKELRVSEMRQKKQQEEQEQCTHTPQICPKSYNIAEDQHRVGAVEDRLLAEGRLTEAKVAAARMMQARAVLAHAKPRPVSAPVRSRIPKASAPAVLRASDDQQLPHSAGDTVSSARKQPATTDQGPQEFQPRILPVSKRLHRSVRVEYALTAWGEARNAKWDAIRAQEEFKAQQLAKRPFSIRPPSAPPNVAIDGSRDAISSWRLHSPDSVAASETPKTRTQKVVDHLQLEAPSFQPRVDSLSRKLDAQRLRDAREGCGVSNR